MSLVNLFQAFFHDVGVDLRRGNIAMPEHQLNGAEIGAAFQEMSGETVAEHVGSKSHTQTRLAAIGRENFPDTNAAEPAAATIQEENLRMGQLSFSEKLRAGIAEITIHECHGFFADGNDAFLVALADAADIARGAVEIHDAQAGQFRDAKAAGIKDLKHGAVAEADGSFLVRLSEQLFDLFEAEIVRQGATDFGRFEILGGILGDKLLHLGVAEKIAKGDEMTSDGAAFELQAIETGEEVNEVVAANGLECELALFGEGFELEQIAAIGGHGIVGEALSPRGRG